MTIYIKTPTVEFQHKVVTALAKANIWPTGAGNNCNLDSALVCIKGHGIRPYLGLEYYGESLAWSVRKDQVSLDKRIDVNSIPHLLATIRSKFK